MDIIVTMMTGSHTLTVHPQGTVGSLKQAIYEKLRVLPQEQKLVFVKTELSDVSQSLSSYGLESGCRVSLLVIKPPATIQVFLRKDGTTNTYDIKRDETVSNFRRRVECRERVPGAQFRLTYEGKDLMEGRMLSEYNIRELGTIDMSLRLRGG